MPAYANVSGKSGVVHFQLGPGRITVTFRGGRSYTYTDAVTGAAHVATMSRLAKAGRGLSSYIARNKGMGYL